MSEPQTPPVATKEKKKFSPLAWVLVGCLALLLIGALITVTCTAFVAKKAKDFAGEMSENPAMAAAEMIVRVNPELELVEKDEDGETLTIRNKETGEIATLKLDDIKEGRFSWEADGKTVTIDGSAAAAGSEGGMITVQEEGEEQQIAIGSGSSNQVPDWVPEYPGAETTAPFLISGPDGVNGTVSFETGDSLAEVRDYFIDEMESAGFGVEKTSFSSGDMETAMLTGADEDRRLVVSITNENNDVTRVAVNFAQGK